MASINTKKNILNLYKFIFEEKDNFFFRPNLANNSLFELKDKYYLLQNRLLTVIEHLDEIEESTLNKVQETYRKLNELFNKVSNLEEDQFINFKNELGEQFINICRSSDDWWSIIKNFIASTDLEKNEVENLKRILHEQQVKAERDSSKIEDLKNRLESEINDFETRYKETFSKAEIGKQKDVFYDEAKKNKEDACIWRWAIILSLLALLFVIWFIIKYFCFEYNCFDTSRLVEMNKICDDCGRDMMLFEISKAILFRIFTISILVYVLTFCIKNYNAQMHNYTINSHRGNALDAALRLIERADEERKNQLLLLVGEAIFAHQKTGHLSKEAEPSNPFISWEKLVEKLR